MAQQILSISLWTRELDDDGADKHRTLLGGNRFRVCIGEILLRQGTQEKWRDFATGITHLEVGEDTGDLECPGVFGRHHAEMFADGILVDRRTAQRID